VISFLSRFTEGKSTGETPENKKGETLASPSLLQASTKNYFFFLAGAFLAGAFLATFFLAAM
jgi:hypothetical protein